MKRRRSRGLMLVALLCCGVVHALVARGGPVAPALVDVGVDGDGCPPGLTPEEEEAWAFAHLPVIHVRP